MNESVRSGPDDQAGAGTEPEKEEEAAITEAEVLACQDGWAKAIQVGGWVGGWVGWLVGEGATRHLLQACKNAWEGIVCYGSVRDVDALEELDLGIQCLVSIPVGASDEDIGESDLAINFAGVTFLPEDHIYADNTGIILSPEPLDIE